VLLNSDELEKIKLRLIGVTREHIRGESEIDEKTLNKRWG